jgi:hypothetical protein
MKVIGNVDKQETGRWLNNELRIHTSHLDEESGPCFDLGGCELVQCKELKETNRCTCRGVALRRQ